MSLVFANGLTASARASPRAIPAARRPDAVASSSRRRAPIVPRSPGPRPSRWSHRGASLIARGKKKKGFAELISGGEAETVVVKKGAANESDRCPCGGGDDKLPYSRCCKPFHKGEKYPQDCVTLMRSRFTGYAKGEGEYVVRTTHPENPIFKDGAKAESGKVVSSLADDVRATCKKVRFYDLEIVSDKPSKKDEHLVGFRYKCRVVGQKGFNELAEEKHSELSTFRRGENGEWLFLDGITGAVDS